MISNPRGGKVAAQDRAVRQTDGEIVAFSDANCTWSPDALRKLVRAFADPEVAYVCGQLRILDAEGGNKEGVYWRYEMKQRAAESQLGSITGGNGSIYAVRRSDYVEVDPRFGHDLSLPYLMVQRGRRAVYEPEAHAFEKPTPSNETEYRRKVRMFEHCWLIVLRGKMLRRLGPLYLLEIVSHRLLRYGSGLLHLVLLATSLALVLARAGSTPSCSACQLGLLAAAAVGVGIARYYMLVTWATLVALCELPAAWRARDVGGRGGHAREQGARRRDRRHADSSSRARCSRVAALAVKLQDGGPVLYRQTRVGRDGADFELLKLRTMVVGAEKQGAGFAVDKGDARITRAGRLLRRLSHRRAAAALERRARRHVGDRAAADAPLPGRAVRRAAAAPARRQAGHHRLGADPRPRRRCPGPSGSSSTSGTSGTTTGRRIC